MNKRIVGVRFEGAAAEAGNEMLYDMIHYPSKSNDENEG